MTGQERIRAALGLGPHWAVRFVGPMETVREIGTEYHRHDVPTRLAPLPSGLELEAADTHQMAPDGGEATAHVLLVDSLCVPQGMTDDIHHSRVDTDYE